jgi:hypothetical protein
VTHLFFSLISCLKRQDDGWIISSLSNFDHGNP